MLTFTATPRHLQRGVNLIEIMVAMTIGLFLVLGATLLYVNTKKTSDIDDSIARLQETARYALSILEVDVRMANYLGATNNGDAVKNKNDNLYIPAGSTGTALEGSTGAADCGAGYATSIDRYIDATNNRFNLNCAAFASAVTSSDTLTVRRVERDNHGADSTRLQICSTRNFVRMTRGQDSLCPATAEYHNMIVHGYYIDQQSNQSTSYPSLRRKTLGVSTATPPTPAFSDVEIIPGVEDMQIELGWDDSDASQLTSRAGAARYVQPENALLTKASGGPNGRIVSVRIWLLIRAETRDPTFTDTQTYAYADRLVANGITTTLNNTGARTKAYRPNDGFRRLLVSRTFYVRNVTGN